MRRYINNLIIDIYKEEFNFFNDLFIIYIVYFGLSIFFVI